MGKTADVIDGRRRAQGEAFVDRRDGCRGVRRIMVTSHRPPSAEAPGAYDGDDSAGAAPVHTDRSTSAPHPEPSAGAAYHADGGSPGTTARVTRLVRWVIIRLQVGDHSHLERRTGRRLEGRLLRHPRHAATVVTGSNMHSLPAQGNQRAKIF